MNISWLSVVSAVILAILGTGGIVALLKIRPEAAQISVSAAQGAVIIQTGVIESLHQENSRLAARIAQIELSASKFASLTSRVEELEIERGLLRKENARLKGRVKQLETSLAKFTNGD